MLLDIHSHILPAVDDGAKTLQDSIKILEKMKSQNITDVIATPHFYPHRDNLEDYTQKTQSAFKELSEFLKDKDLPNIYLGCEILYYSGISKVSVLKDFTLNGSNYLLLELNPFLLSKNLFSELLYLREERGIIPIIAHVERYYRSRHFGEFLKFIKENRILTQVNATSFFAKKYNKVLHTLFCNGLVTFLATDSHSIDMRPPMLKHAFKEIELKYGKETVEKLIENSNSLLYKITQKDTCNEIQQP